MYIAVVADNIAERKQTERLLGRANQALCKDIGTLYIDSYGDEDAFLHACMKYDFFIIDFDHDYDHSLSVAEKLRNSDATGQIAICKSEGDTFLHEFAEQNIFTINKPILTAPLHELIRQIHDIMQKKKMSETILEIRGEIETKYVNKDDVVFVDVYEKEHKLCFHFNSLPDFEIVGSIDDLVKLLGDYPEFRMANKSTAINDNYVLSETSKGIRLLGDSFIKTPSLFEKIDRMLYRKK